MTDPRLQQPPYPYVNHEGVTPLRQLRLLKILSFQKPFTHQQAMARTKSSSDSQLARDLRFLVILGHLTKPKVAQYRPVAGSVHAFNERVLRIPGVESVHILVTQVEARRLAVNGSIQKGMDYFKFAIRREAAKPKPEKAAVPAAPADAPKADDYKTGTLDFSWKREVVFEQHIDILLAALRRAGLSDKQIGLLVLEEIADLAEVPAVVKDHIKVAHELLK
jgi:hypothetical protein